VAFTTIFVEYLVQVALSVETWMESDPMAATTTVSTP